MPDYSPIHDPIPKRGKKRLEIGKTTKETKGKEKSDKEFAGLEFVYYLFAFSRDSKQFHFLLFSFVLKKTRENDKSRSAADGRRKRKD